jgi:hypothetical protein
MYISVINCNNKNILMATVTANILLTWGLVLFALIAPIAVNTILILDEKEDIPIIIAALIKENTIESYRIIVLES